MVSSVLLGYSRCSVIIRLANGRGGGGAVWGLDGLVCGGLHGYHGNGCVGLISGLPAGEGSEARLGKRLVRGEFASVLPWLSAGGGRSCSPPRAPLQHPFSSGLKGDPPTVKAQPHHTAHWETASELLSLSLFPYPQSLFSTSFHPILSLSHHELLVSSP